MNRKELSDTMEKIPELTACLYDLGLMPEQVAENSISEGKMLAIAAYFISLYLRLSVNPGFDV
jgi:hypothetical protein